MSNSTATRCRKSWSIRSITPSVEDDPQGRRQILFHRLPAERDLAGARARSARPHHPQSRDRDRAPAGRLLHPRRGASAAAQSQGGRRRDRMHESTVSRVTANKYMATNRGIFELKYFFTASIAAADGGEAHSAEAVRHRIKQLIDCEIRRRCAVRRHDRGTVARGRYRHRPPHGRQIPRSDAYPVLGAAPARETGR
jgi:hypothetical protein